MIDALTVNSNKYQSGKDYHNALAALEQAINFYSSLGLDGTPEIPINAELIDCEMLCDDLDKLDYTYDWVRHMGEKYDYIQIYWE